MGDFLLRRCPVCDHETKSTLEIQAPIIAETMTTEALKPYWNGFFKDKSFFTYYRCNECRLLYCPAFFTSSQLEYLYAQMPDNTAGVSVSTLSQTQNGYFRSFQKYSSLEGNYIEVGPDIGLFTKNCLVSGNFDHFWLFEPNIAVWPSLQALLKDSDYDLSREMSNFDIIPDDSASAVVLIHVLDHFLDPLKFLQTMRKKLKKDGILFVVTHDESSWMARILASRWPPFCLQHPQLYRPETVSTLFQKAGFKLVEIDKTYNYFPVTYLAKHMFWALGIKYTLFPKSERFSLPLKLGNIASIAKAN